MRSPGAVLGDLPEPAAEQGGAYVHGGVEPPLEEVLQDPIVRVLMRRDGVGPGKIRRMRHRGRGPDRRPGARP